MLEAAHTFDDGTAYERGMGRWSCIAGADLHRLGRLQRQVSIGSMLVAVPAFSPNWCSRGANQRRCLPSTLKRRKSTTRAASQLRNTHIFRLRMDERCPSKDSHFDVVAAALVLNFIPDRPSALSEMRRVACAGGIVASFVWDYAVERAPNWPLRLAMRQIGADVPAMPGTKDSTLDALNVLFKQAGFENIATTTIDVSLTFSGFDDFWQAQTPSYSPVTQMIAAMPISVRAQLIESVRAGLPIRPDGTFEYFARANAIKARVPY